VTILKKQKTTRNKVAKCLILFGSQTWARTKDLRINSPIRDIPEISKVVQFILNYLIVVSDFDVSIFTFLDGVMSQIRRYRSQILICLAPMTPNPH
jgi:hypothetical protein